MRGLDPKSIRASYLPAVNHYFRSRGLKTRFDQAMRDSAVKDSLAGFERLFHKQNPEANNLKLAFGMDLAVLSQDIMRQSDILFNAVPSDLMPLMAWRYFTSMTVGIYFMLRKSEHIGSARATAQPLLCRHVTFFDGEENVIPHEWIPDARAEKMVLNVRFAKTDSSGFGRRTFHVRQEDREGVCVVSIAQKWMSMAIKRGASPSDLFYDCAGLPPYCIKTLHIIMELTVQSLGVNGYGMKATSHSLRYGGATMMAAAGFPQYLIAHYGGWTVGSKSLNRYARPSEDSISLVSRHMSSQALQNPSRIHIQDLIARRKK